MPWLPYALLSAAAAALTAILGKLGVAGVPSTLATAIRTVVVLVFVWSMAGAFGEVRALTTIPRNSWVFLTLSGLATGISWLAYYRALQLGQASQVAPIDKLSLPLTVLLATLVLGEHVSLKAGLGVGLMVLGALLTM